MFPPRLGQKRSYIRIKNVLLRGQKMEIEAKSVFFTKIIRGDKIYIRNITKILQKDKKVLWYYAFKRRKRSQKIEKRKIEIKLSRDIRQIRLISSTDRQTDNWIKISLSILFDIPHVLYFPVMSPSPKHLECHTFSWPVSNNFS